MKVLRISHSSGVNAYRERDRQLVDACGVDVRLIIPEKWEHLGGDSKNPDESFRVVKAKTFGTGSIPLFFYEPICIASQLKNFRPDVVDIHEEPYSVSCFELVNLVQHFVPNAAIVFYSAQNLNKRYPVPFSWTERFVYTHTNAAYPCSEGVKEVLQQKGFSKNCDVIPLGVDTNMFKPLAALQDNAREVVIGFFGRIEAYKGIDTVVEALSQMRTMIDWRLLLVGAGSYADELKTLATKCSIADKITWVGEVGASEIPSYINKCDVVVIPSKTTSTWKEQFGRAVTEAMACGVPVIASDSGSLPEVVGDAGIVVPEQNTAALSTALVRLLENPEQRAALGAKSLERVSKLYTWRTVANMMHNLYEIAIQDKLLELSKSK